MSLTSPFELKLPEETRRTVELEIMRRIQCAVADSADRDDMFEQYADQVEGLIGGNTDQPWEGACELDDPITRGQFLTTWGMVAGAMDRSPQVMVEAASQDDVESAAKQEAYIPIKLAEGGWKKAGAEVVFNALRYPVAIAYLGWKQVVRDDWEEFDADPETGLEVSDEDQVADVEYEKGYKSTPEVLSDGLDVRCIDSPDFYIYPANAVDLQSANGCGNRLLWTADELLANIEDLELDAEAVYEVIRQGPTWDATDGRKNRDDQQGVQEADDRDGLYEIFTWYCKPPLLMEDEGADGKPKFLVPERYLNKDLCVICCPDAQVMLRMGLSTHGHTRPYVPFYSWIVPNSFYGWCIPQILDSVQAEANANIQHTVNSMQMQIQPGFMVQENMTRRYENLKQYPGAIWPFMNKDDIIPMQIPQTANAGYETQQWLGTKAEALITAGGFGSIQPKQRKAAEVQATSASAATKADNILRNMNFGIEELFTHAVALCAENMPDDGDDFLDEEDHTQRITAKNLKGRFIYRPVANGQNADPQSRVAVAEAKNHAADEYLALMGNPQTPPDVKRLKWHNTRAVLRDMGEYAPEEWIGPEPKEQPAPPPQMQMIQGGVQ